MMIAPTCWWRSLSWRPSTARAGMRRRWWSREW